MHDNVARIAVGYALLAFSIHAMVAGISLIPSMRAIPLDSGDAVTYLIPAKNLLQHGVFSRETTEPFLWEPYRTPGYPMLIASAMAIVGTPAAVLFFAAFTAALAAWSAVRLTSFFGGHGIALHVSGLIASFLPNSLGLSAMMLTDAIAGHLMLVWLYFLVTGSHGRSYLRLGFSALMLVVLQSLKPTFNIALVLVVLGVFLLYHNNRKVVVLVLLCLLTLPLPYYFSVRNLETHGVRSASLLGVETAREYLQVRYLRDVSGENYEDVNRRVRSEDRLEAQQRTVPASLYGRLYTVKEEKVKQFFTEHPSEALRLMFTEMIQQAAAPQEFFPQVLIGDLPKWGRATGSLLTITFWLCAFLGGFVLWRRGNRGPALMVAGVLLFFLVTGSVSHYVGARLRFPADMAAIPLIAIGMNFLAEKTKRFSLR